MGKSKEVRGEILADGGWWAKHSLNQYSIRKYTEGQRKFLGENPKAEKAARRHRVNEWYQKEYPTRRWQFRRSLEAVLNGRATPEHVSYVLDNLAGFETELYSPATQIRLEEPNY